MGIGGVKTGVRDLSRYLNKKKINNYILSEKGRLNPEDKDLNIISLKNLRFKNPFHQIKIRKIIKNIIFEKGINLVHISSRAPAFFLIEYIKKKGIKIVTSVHSEYKSDNFLKKIYNNSLLKGNLVIFNSKFTFKNHQNNLDKLPNYKIIDRGIDLKYFKNNTKILNSNFRYIFLPGRPSVLKGHLTLINFFSKLLSSNKNINYKLLLITSHQNRIEKKIDDLIHSLNLRNRIKFVKPTLNIKMLYEMSYIVVSFSSRPEGFGRTIAESLSMSKPIIATNLGGSREQLVKFDKNLLFQKNSYFSFKTAFDYVESNYKFISKKGRNFVKKYYSSENMCKKTLESYLELIKN